MLVVSCLLLAACVAGSIALFVRTAGRHLARWRERRAVARGRLPALEAGRYLIAAVDDRPVPALVGRTDAGGTWRELLVEGGLVRLLPSESRLYAMLSIAAAPDGGVSGGAPRPGWRPEVDLEADREATERAAVRTRTAYARYARLGRTFLPEPRAVRGEGIIVEAVPAQVDGEAFKLCLTLVGDGFALPVTVTCVRVPAEWADATPGWQGPVGG